VPLEIALALFLIELDGLHLVRLSEKQRCAEIDSLPLDQNVGHPRDGSHARMGYQLHHLGPFLGFQREFELLIMVEVRIEEMFGSD
jgi:hypothetical protein